MDGAAYDDESLAIIKLNNSTVLYLKEVTRFLALVCILREENFKRKGLIDYNFHEVFEVGSLFDGAVWTSATSSGTKQSVQKSPVLNGSAA